MTILQLNSQGDEVKLLQQQLISLGYPLLADGLFGNLTKQALIQFQTDHHLLADGIAGINTFNEINSLLTVVPIILHGIDISHFTGAINWATLGTEVSFVYCKASQGADFKDPKFQTFFNELKNLRIFRGAYHFLNFQNASADQQVQNFLNCGIDFSLSEILPPVLDIEWQVPDTLNPYILANKEKCIQLIRDWLSGVQKSTGRKPMIYTNKVFWNEYLGNPEGFGDFPLWIAAYQSAQPTLPPGWTKYNIWQNSGTGKIASVAGNVDTDQFLGSIEDLKQLTISS